MGLKVSEVTDKYLDVVWNIHRLNSEKTDIISQESEEKMKEKMKDMTPGILDEVPADIVGDEQGNRS